MPSDRWLWKHRTDTWIISVKGVGHIRVLRCIAATGKGRFLCRLQLLPPGTCQLGPIIPRAIKTSA